MSMWLSDPARSLSARTTTQSVPKAAATCATAAPSISTALALKRSNKAARTPSARAFRILTDDFTEASGELTPKMSIKRHIILDKRSGDIEALYAEAKKEHTASAH